MSDKQHFYITTPIYYVNDKPHIGHAYTTIACDVMARFQRLDGKSVKFLTGTDEHGQKVEKSAEKAGKDPQHFTDEMSHHFRALADILHTTHDDFIRTTEPRHKAAVQALWKRLEERGYIYESTYAGWYSVRDEAFYQESELVDGKAPTGADVEWVEEPSYFFKLSAFQDQLLDFYKECPDFVIPSHRFNEVISFVKGGKEKVEGHLKDLSISRTTFSWGIPVPGDEKHVMYVWLDALTNYMSALGYPNKYGEAFSQYWPADMHVVGKDILRFHAVYWPAFLMAAGLPLPNKIVAHGWWTNEGQKISKSLGNVIDPVALVEQYGLDPVRYFMLREVPFGNDGNFSKESLVQRINSDLANTIGNLVQRTLSMIQKNCSGRVPKSTLVESANFIGDDPDGYQLLSVTHDKDPKSILKLSRRALERMAFSEVIKVILSVASDANEYIDKQAPWKLKKEDEDRMAHVLYVLAESIRGIALILQPFMPDSSSKILDQLAVPRDKRSFACVGFEYALVPGTVLPAPVGVFPRVDAEAA